MRGTDERQVPAEPDVRRRDGLGLAGRVLDAAPVDQERDAIDDRVQEEGILPEPREQRRSDDEPEAQAGERRALEASGRLAAQELVPGGRERDEAEDRRDARGGRGTFEQTGQAERRKVHGP